MAKIKKDYLAFVIIFLAVLFLLWPVLLPGNNQIVYGGDLSSQFYYWKGYLIDNLRSGIIPFWNPYNFSGTPFLAHPAVAPFYPGTLLFLLMPLNLAFSVNYFLHLLIGGIGLYYLARIYSGRLEATLSAVIFIFSGYFSARIYAGHFDLLTTAVWIPWVFSSFILLSAGKRSYPLLIRGIVSLSMLVLAGYSAYLVFSLEFLGLYLFYLLIFKNYRFKNFLISSAIMVSLSLILTAIQWIPSLQLTQNSVRAGGLSYSLASWGSLPLSGLKLFLSPLNRMELNKISFNLGGGPVANPFDHYPGSVAILTLIISSLIIPLKRILLKHKQKSAISADYWFFITVCLTSLWWSFGSFVPLSLHRFFYLILPAVRFIRIPIQNLVLLVVLIPLLLAMVFEVIKSRPVKIVLAFFILADLFIFARQYIFLTSVPGLKNDISIVRDLSGSKANGRLLPAFSVVSPLLSRFDLNSSLKYHFASVSGYDPVILKNYYNFIDTENGNKESSLPYFNVSIPPIIPGSKTAALLNVTRILNQDGSISENKQSLDRFYFGKSGKCQDKNSSISIVNYSINNIKLKTENECSVLLNSSEVYFPGWKVKVDNRPADFNEPRTFRSVLLTAGVHSVEFFYFPAVYIYSAIISLVAIFMIIIIVPKFYEH